MAEHQVTLGVESGGVRLETGIIFYSQFSE
jgi:hypothetical protein